MAVAAVPWRAGDAHRQRALDWVRPRLTAEGHDVRLGSCPPGYWRKAVAVHDALAGHEGLAVIHDADVWVEPPALEAAIAAVLDGEAPWAIPHRMVYRLGRDATADLYAGQLELEPQLDRRLLDQRPYRGHPGGGIVVLDTEVWREAPLDARYAGWGHEDDAWYLALVELVGKPWRGAGDLWHLWHPPQERRARNLGAAKSAALFARYKAARGHRDRMADLAAEARRHLWEVADR